MEVVELSRPVETQVEVYGGESQGEVASNVQQSETVIAQESGVNDQASVGQVGQLELLEKEISQTTEQALAESTSQETEKKEEKGDNRLNMLSLQLDNLSSFIKETDQYISKLLEQLITEKHLLTDKQSGKTSGKVSVSQLTHLNALLQNLNKLKEKEKDKEKDSRENQVDNQENMDPKDSDQSGQLALKSQVRARLSHITNSIRRSQGSEKGTEGVACVSVPTSDTAAEAQVAPTPQPPAQPPQASETSVKVKTPEGKSDDVKEEAVVNRSIERRTVTYSNVRDILHVAKEGFHFGLVLPGQILEEDLEIKNKTKQNVVVRVQVLCLNQEYDDHDEYVFSVRKASILDYNEQFIVMVGPLATLHMKVALKVPSIKSKTKLVGVTQISVKDLDSLIRLPIEANAEVPVIYSNKELYLHPLPYPVIKIAYKNGKKQDYKIPIRNNSSFAVSLEYELMNDSEEESPVDFIECFCFPMSAVVPANGVTLLTLMVKPLTNVNWREVPRRQNLKKMILAKVKNSSLIFHFLLWIETFG
eukprot:TRINITY_DN2218_c0_g1_i4.p1 TRINITY_DN2218_c0_g1~~TRINITY_DN2218_c0_g1_i4.p1  ORF type:complete len:533 (-),score=152.22 TRINITY_DN2218_c0_g1_i4:541-2139(-)